MVPPSTTGLYWSIRGEVACARHAPDTMNPRWATERWAPLPFLVDSHKATKYQCQHCAVDGRAVVHFARSA